MVCVCVCVFRSKVGKKKCSTVLLTSCLQHPAVENSLSAGTRVQENAIVLQNAVQLQGLWNERLRSHLFVLGFSAPLTLACRRWGTKNSQNTSPVSCKAILKSLNPKYAKTLPFLKMNYKITLVCVCQHNVINQHRHKNRFLTFRNRFTR